MIYCVNSIRLKIENAELRTYFLNSIEFKNIKIKVNKDFKVSQHIFNIWDKKYSEYISVLQKLDNYNGYELNYYYELNKNSFINIHNNSYSKLISLFNGNKPTRTPKGYIKTLSLNILEEHMKNINSRKVHNNLTKPHYFFTYRYNEKYMPSQIKQWTSSVYNFLKSEKAGNTYKDLYTSKFLNSFFNLKSSRRKHIFKSSILNAIKIKVTSILSDNVNTMIKYTSNRTRLAVRKLTFFPAQLLTLDWLIKQINSTFVYKEYFEINKTNFKAGFYPKKKKYFRKFKRILISKPLFKHTSFNLIIDLFIYHNKRYTLKRISNITLRRTVYKYMYSMYINCYDKINDTINRPRFFYINLIEPKIHKYYDWVVKYYGELIIIKKKPMLILLYLFLLQANFVNKMRLTSIKTKTKTKTNINNIINNNLYNNISNESENVKLNKNVNSSSIINNFELNNKNKLSIVFKRRIRNNKLNKYNYLLIKGNKELYNLNKDIKEDKELDSYKIISKSKKSTIKNNRSKYIKYKTYLVDLERKSNSPVDLNSLSLWNSKGLGKHYRTPMGTIDEATSNYKKKKHAGFSYNNYKKKYLNNYNDDNLISEYKKFKNNSDLWNKRRNKLAPSVSYGDDLLNNKSKKIDNNNSLFFEKKTIVSSTKKNVKYINNDNSFILDASDKEKYIHNMEKEMKKGSLLNTSFTSFYINYNNINLNKFNNVKSFISFTNKNEVDQVKSMNIPTSKDRLSTSQNLKTQIGNNISTNKFYLWGTNSGYNSKILWDKLDYSIIGTLSKHVQMNKNLLLGSNIIQINSLLNEIKRFKGFGNIWYLLYFINIIKKEFYNVNRDILVSKNINVRPYLLKRYDNTFFNVKKTIWYYKYKNHKFKIKLSPSFFSNERENNLNIKYGYNEKLFKPYYRYMIPLFILNSYYTFTYYISNYNPINFILSNLTKKFNNIKHNNIIVFNFLIVKILLDLLHYNYRSWLRVKSKYYYLRKVKLYKRKLYKLTINNWMASIRFLKKLKKTPKNLWLRYHKNAGHFVERVIKNSELNTKRKIFIPFALYIEDILFSIYGKWVIIRLWPLKYYYLSSYMLAKRVIMLLLWRKKRRGRNRKFSISRYSLKLIESFRSLEIKKAYSYYVYNASAWPNDLLLKMNNMNKAHSLNYKNLEFFNKKEERFHYLNSYTLMYNNLSNFIPLFNYNYKSIYKDYINFISSIVRKNIRPKLTDKYEYAYYWLLPLKNYIMELTKNTDITGIKFKLSGRPSWKRSNNRKVRNTYDHGNRLTPRHLNPKTYKYFSLYTPRLRGYLKSHTESSMSISKSRNGSVSVKVWISSTLSVDVHELLLHLVRIKDLYSQLVNRYYLVNKNILAFNKEKNIKRMNINKYYLINKNNLSSNKTKMIKWKKKIKYKTWNV